MAGGLPLFSVHFSFHFPEKYIDLMRIKVYNEIVSNMSSVALREATLWQDSFFVLTHQLVLIPHPDASGKGQYVPRCDNAAAYNYYRFNNHFYAPLIVSPPCSSALRRLYTCGAEPRA